MTVLYGTLIIATVFSLFADKQYSLTDKSPYYRKPSLFWVFAVAFLLAFVSGMRSAYVDTQTYMAFFKLIPYPENLFSSIWESLKNDRDFGFEIFQIILKCFTDNPQWLIFITALITNLLFIGTFYKYSQPFALTVFLYITNDIYTYSMNGIRQYMAVAIIFAGIKLMLDGKWKKFILIILLATTIHRSAILALPIYFISRRKAWTKSTVLIILSMLSVFFAFSYIFPGLGDVLSDNALLSKYSFVWGRQIGEGSNIMRVFVAAVPVVLAFIDRKKLHAIWPESDIFVNINIFNVFFLLMGLYDTMFARMVYFTVPFQIVLLCFIASKGFTPKIRKILTFLMVVCYFIFFWYWMDYKMNFVYYSQPLGIRIG